MMTAAISRGSGDIHVGVKVVVLCFVLCAHTHTRSGIVSGIVPGYHGSRSGTASDLLRSGQRFGHHDAFFPLIGQPSASDDSRTNA